MGNRPSAKQKLLRILATTELELPIYPAEETLLASEARNTEKIAQPPIVVPSREASVSQSVRTQVGLPQSSPPIIIMRPVFYRSPSFVRSGLESNLILPFDRLFPPLSPSLGCRLHGFLGLSLNDRTILFLVILLDKTISVG